MTNPWSLRFPDGSQHRLVRPTLVGRQQGCDLLVDHRSVSSHHALLIPALDGVEVRDLGSTNGTAVGGKRVTRAVAADGVTIELGSSEAMRVIRRPRSEAPWLLVSGDGRDEWELMSDPVHVGGGAEVDPGLPAGLHAVFRLDGARLRVQLLAAGCAVIGGQVLDEEGCLALGDGQRLVLGGRELAVFANDGAQSDFDASTVRAPQRKLLPYVVELVPADQARTRGSLRIADPGTGLVEEVDLGPARYALVQGLVRALENTDGGWLSADRLEEWVGSVREDGGAASASTVRWHVMELRKAITRLDPGVVERERGAPGRPSRTRLRVEPRAARHLPWIGHEPRRWVRRETEVTLTVDLAGPIDRTGRVRIRPDSGAEERTVSFVVSAEDPDRVLATFRIAPALALGFSYRLEVGERGQTPPMPWIAVRVT